LGSFLSSLIDQKVEFPESKQIANALLLGQKESLDKEIKNAYSETGTMHILAVSGLHVGIIYAILLLPLKRFKSDSKFRKGYLLTVVGLIWLYAVMTGFSPSVVRASTMFSLVTAGQMRKKKPSIWNVLAFSAMLMMVVEPEVIFDVGFQLSYLAVAGIVGLQPVILRWWIPGNVVLEYFWQSAAVSLAAQLVTFPLSVFYFHQFPTYFLLANLIVVPLAFLIMAVGVPFLFLGWIPMLGEVMGWLVNWMIYIQNQITFFIQLLPLGKIDRLTITFSGMVLVWILLLIWGNWELGNRKKLVVLAMVFFASWGVEGLIREINRPTEQLWFFKKGKQEAIMDIQLGDHHLSWNQSFPSDQLTFSIDPNRLMHHRFPRPIPLRGIVQDSSIWFPVLDFKFFPKQNQIEWQSLKPEKIQEFHRENSGIKSVQDSTLYKKAGFRAIF
jgi:competence protein ComEC